MSLIASSMSRLESKRKRGTRRRDRAGRRQTAKRISDRSDRSKRSGGGSLAEKTTKRLAYFIHPMFGGLVAAGFAYKNANTINKKTSIMRSRFEKIADDYSKETDRHHAALTKLFVDNFGNNKPEDELFLSVEASRTKRDHVGKSVDDLIGHLVLI